MDDRAKLVSRPWQPKDLIDDLQSIIDEEPNNYLNTRRTTLCMARDYLKEHFAEPKWIPVSERLPDIVDCYLVVVKYKYDFEKEYNYDTDVATFHFGYDCTYIDGQWNTYVDLDEGQQYLHVTHWMPLPEPPKENTVKP